MSLRFARRRDDTRCLLGDVNGTVRIGVSNFVAVRPPTGLVMLAWLPRRATSANGADLTLTGDQLDDLFLPEAGTPVTVEWMTNPIGPTSLRVDISSLPATGA